MARLRQTLGIVLCVASAMLAALAFHNTNFRAFVPLAFILVLGFLANKFGTWVGILSTIVTTMIFTQFLFGPEFSLHTTGSPEKNNLVWMVIAGIALSDILGVPPSSSTTNHRNRNMILRG
jgi:K+-sensing histidine kinase KdpD